MDLCKCDLEGKRRVFLITVDHFSDYFEIDELKTPNAIAVVQVCRKNFSRFGIPQEVSSDGGPQFTNEAFKRFAESWGFKHSISAPYHQQANGKSESAVKIAKLLMKKADESKQDFWRVLLQWRNTPNKIESSPVQRLLNRRTRSGIPMSEEKYSPNVEEEVKERIVKSRQQAMYSYDRKTKPLPALEFGQPVYVKIKPSDSNWQKGTVLDPVTDRSTVVEVAGRNYRRDNTCIEPAHPPDALQSDQVEPRLDTKFSKQAVVEHHQYPEPNLEDGQPAMTEVDRPRRTVRVPKRYEDFEMY